ncbi:MAG: ATP-binding protein, partial [Acidimicrobiia bacterium]
LQIHLTGLRRDGDRFPAAVTVSKLDLDGEITFTAIVRDMTEQRMAQAKLEHLVESKGELIASVSHELRTPLTGILGFVELLRDRRQEYTADEQEAMISTAAAEASDLSNIVDDLLAAARAEMGTLEVAAVRVDLSAQVAQVLESRDDFRRVAASGERMRVVADPARVRQILRNLLTNAVRYGGAKVAVETAARIGCGVLRVVDDGDGIPAADRERIFEPFERSKSHPGLPGSVGLGLSVSRNLARLMGGELTYRYRDGRSVFELALPVAG